MTKESLNSRIRFVRDYLKRNQIDFSAEIGSQSEYSKIELGKVKPAGYGAMSAEAWAVTAGYPAVRKKIEAISAYTGSIAAVLLHEESQKLVFREGKSVETEFFLEGKENHKILKRT